MGLDSVRQWVRRWWPAGVAVLAVGGLAWWVRPSQPAPEEPRARLYGEFTACMLTDSRGISGREAAPVWAALAEASDAAGTQVEYVTVSGRQTVENAITYLNGLAMGHCDLIFAVGEVQVSAVQQSASHFPQVRFFTVGGGSPASNMAIVDGDPKASVKKIVSEAVAATSR